MTRKTPPRQNSIDSNNPPSATSASADHDEIGIVPRSARKRRKSKSDRGLPSDAILAQLATAYLKAQHAAFPTFAASGVLPPATTDVIDSMVEDFKLRHRGTACSPAVAGPLHKAVHPVKLAAGYFRYSCDNSKPTSIEDQMGNALRKAAGEQRFIPWCFIHADYSVTGLDASRQGYSSLKAVLADPQQPIDTLYIDDFTRASRDELEWWKLAQTVKKLRKRMVGASDQFDLDNPHWDMQLTIFGLLSRLFIKSLRQKVCRGMRGAISRGGALGKLPLGFTRRAKLDASGRPIVSSGGKPQREICIDPQTSEHRLLMYQLFAQENWTLQRIMRHFNQLEVDGWNGWTIGAVRKLLWSPTAIGVFRWHMTSREYDPETERWVTIKNPRKDWVVRHASELAIVPMDLWRAARRKLSELSRTYGPRNRGRKRNRIAPTTLFSGMLFCQCCNEELKLVRSTDGYKQLGSLNGHHRAHGCQLKTSKSTRLIEACLLDYLRNVLLTSENVQHVVSLANQVLENEASKPSPDLKPLVRRVEQIRQKIQRLVRRSAETDDTGIAASYEAEIKRLRTELAGIEPQIRAAENAEQHRFERLDATNAVALLAELRDVLNRDVAIAGPAIRELTGPIQIREELVDGTKSRHRWIAQFSPQMTALLSKLNPTECGRFAASRIPAVAVPVEVVIDEVPRYERMAPLFKKLSDNGVSINMIAASHGMSWGQVKQALTFAETGERPKRKSRKTKNPGSGGIRCQYKNVAAEVVRLRDDLKLSFREIARELQISERVALKAYDSLRPDAVQDAAKTSCRPRRGSFTRLPRSTFENIARRLDEGKRAREIAEIVGCSEQTVYREVKKRDLTAAP